MDVKKRKILALTLFGIYCILLLWVILFKLMPPCEGVAYLSGTRSISWIPFDFDTNPHHHFLEVMLNFLAFVPFGLLLKQAFMLLLDKLNPTDRIYIVTYAGSTNSVTKENILNAYNEAVKNKYRFFSFGDAMFIK